MPHYQVRFSSAGNFFGPVDVALYKDSIYIISLMRDLFAIKITSQPVKKTCQLLYDMAWVTTLTKPDKTSWSKNNQINFN